MSLGCVHAERVNVHGAMPVAALQVAVVLWSHQGLDERPAVDEEVFNLLPLSLGVGFWDGGVPRAILLCNVFCAVKQPNRIVIQQAAIDEYFLGFSNCSEEKGNGHESSGGFRDRHVRGGIARVNFACACIQLRGDEMQFGTPQSSRQIGKFAIVLVCFFSMSFPIKS